MQVLGPLVKLPIDPRRLPLPWFHRAPLGLESRTHCFVAIVEGKGRAIGEIVVSVLDPHEWDQILRVECRRQDEPGVIAEAIDLIEGLNIELAESATTEAGELHDVTLICNKVQGEQKKPTSTKIKKEFTCRGFHHVYVEPFQERNIRWVTTATVNQGWVKKVPWREKIKHYYGDCPEFEAFDLDRAVVSVDTHARILRFVFPYRDACTLRIEHLNRPGVLKVLTRALMDCKANVLSCLLRRGGAKPGNNVLVAVCEPRNGKNPNYLSSIQDRLEQCDSRFHIEVEVSRGTPAENIISPRSPDTHIARMPTNLEETIRKTRRELPEGRTPVFFSRRVIDSHNGNRIPDHVRSILRGCGCVPLEASRQTGYKAPATVFAEVTSKMWVASAGIVLVAGLEEADALGKNLPHEFGFLQGQSKPLLLLLQGSIAHDIRKEWSNIDGIWASHFADGELAFSPSHPNSLDVLIQEWIETIRGEG